MTDDTLPETRWWLCPNRECDHGNILHDRDDFYEGRPTCCVEGCPCGHNVGRHAIGIDLDETNADLARQRVGLFLEIDGVGA